MITTAEFGGVASAQGLDVSNFQGTFDWAGAVRQVPQLAFGFCKMTEGLTFTDPDSAWNWGQLSKLGLIRGGYHFGHPAEDARQQASYFLARAAKLGLIPDDILALDLEVTDGKSAAQVASWAQTFMAAVSAARPDSPCVLYTMISFANGGECAGLGKYPLWLAYPNAAAPVAPPPWARWTFWQWGTRNGTDADAFNGTVHDLVSWLDSFGPAKPPAGGKGPYLHTLDGQTTLAEYAASRSTTPYRLLKLAAGTYTDGDVAHLAGQQLPAGTRIYTANP